MGGGEITLAGLLPEGRSTLRINVRAPGRARATYNVEIQVGCSDCDDGTECTTNACDTSVQVCFHPAEANDTACDYDGEIGTCVSGLCEEGFPCTEQGILDAIALGGGPHTFACGGPTTVATQARIVIDNDVILDGEGNLTIDGNDEHRVLSVEAGVSVELIGITVSGGFLSNQTPGGAGILNDGALMLTDCMIEWNTSLAEAGAIRNEGSLSLVNSTVRDNYGNDGMGIYSLGEVTLTGSIVSNNESLSLSSAAQIASMQGTLTLVDSYVANYYYDGDGLYAYGVTKIVNSTVFSSAYHGMHSGGTATSINSTLEAPREVISGDGNGTFTLISSTVRTTSGAYSTIRGADFVVANSVIVGDLNPATPTCSGNVTSLGGNIESPSNECGFTDPTDLVSVTEAELNLGPLQNNGGPTETHALLPGSVAIDHVPAAMCVDAEGQPLTTDQRGVARPQGGACDVGAFEWSDCSGTACDDGNDCTADHCDPPDHAWCANPSLPDGSVCDFGGLAGTCVSGTCDPSVFPCTEQGIRDAIARGGGPYTFACDGPTIVTTQSEIVIDNDVILDGEGNLSVDGNDDHRVLSVELGVTAELVGIAVSGGRGVFSSALLGAGIYNAGTLRLVGVALIDNDNLGGIGGGAAIHNEGTATLTDCRISGNRGRLSGDAAGIQNAGTLTAFRTAISENSNSDLGASVINDSGTLTLIDSSVVRNYTSNDTIRVADGSLTLVNSTVSESEGGACYPSDAILVVGSSASATIINSTLMPDPGHFWTVLGGGSIYVANSIIGSTTTPICGSFAGCGAPVINSGGGNIETLTDSCGLTDPTDQVAVSEAALNLGPLTDNGGPTMTHALLPGSVAIDRIPAAMCIDGDAQPLTTDQRGEPRPETGGTMCDVGAFEAQP